MAIGGEAEHYRTLFESLPVGIWEEDFTEIRAFLDRLPASGIADLGEYLRQHTDVVRQLVRMIKVLDVNRRAVEFYGAQSKDELIERLPDLFDERTSEIFGREIAALARGEQTFACEVPARTLSGEPRVADMCVCLEPEVRPPWSRVIVSFVDITERKRLEEHYRQSQKLESIGRLAGGVAHDFNNLLTVINGYCELLLEQAGESSPLRAGLLEIRNAGERARELTQQLLAFGGRLFLRPRTLNVNALVAEIAEGLRPLLGKRIEFSTVLDPGLGAVMADPDQIREVITRLIRNAGDSMPEGGKLGVETSNVDLDAAFAARHPGFEPGAYVRIAFRDTGPGLDEEAKARLFEPFAATGRPRADSSLGLATAFGIVRQSGGHIRAESQPGQGSTFEVYLPRAGEIAAAPERTAVAETFEPRGAATVLVVDDQREVRRLVCEVFAGSGYRVIEADGGAEALELAERHAGSLHLLVTDIVMPGMTGKELAQRIKTACPSIRVIFVSGYSDQTGTPGGSVEQDAVFLQKPLSPPALLRTARELLSR